MDKLKHSKFKNTGLIFEILLKRITSETISSGTSKALGIFKKYFYNTELGKEYKLYEFILKQNNLQQHQAQDIINIISEYCKRLNKKQLKSEKFNIIKEIKLKYNINEFFDQRVNNYKELASTYILLETNYNNKVFDLNILNKSKQTLLEYMYTNKTTKHNSNPLNEFQNYDKSLRTLIYKITLDKFNNKYKDLSPKHRKIIKEFICSTDNSSELREYYNKEILYIKKTLKENLLKINDERVKLSIDEIIKLLTPLKSREVLKENHLTNILEYYSLIDELTKVCTNIS